MATDCEKRLLKEFLDGLDTNKLCEIARSVFHGGGIKVLSREDAEMLLLTQSYTRIFSSKKVPVTTLLKYLISKGLTPQTPELTKSDLCMAFKTLIENQPDYSRPILPLEQFSQPSTFGNNMIASPQNNNMMVTSQSNMMHYQPSQPQIQQMPIPIPLPITQMPHVPTTKARKERENELLEDFIEMFAKHFYELFNDLGTPGKNQLDGRHFYENCTMSVKILGGCEEINEKCDDSSSILQCLIGIKKEHQLFFSPHLGDGVKWKKESHGLVKVHIGGTLHQGIGRMVGMFEQQFILREDPQAENTWKILNTSLMMKSMESLTTGPTLSIQGPQTNNLQIDII